MGQVHEHLKASVTRQPYLILFSSACLKISPLEKTVFLYWKTCKYYYFKKMITSEHISSYY